MALSCLYFQTDIIFVVLGEGNLMGALVFEGKYFFIRLGLLGLILEVESNGFVGKLLI